MKRQKQEETIDEDAGRMPVGMAVSRGRIGVESHATLGAAPSQIHELGSPMGEHSDARAAPVNVTMRRPTLSGVPA
ncbi:MAG TPA: hypothetical protein VKB09_10520, partial [Thermomicrobiales bacterium]|nr:hypothetical protein [Thermomicrobiales bacterium]